MTFKKLIPPAPFSWEEKGELKNIYSKQHFNCMFDKLHLKNRFSSGLGPAMPNAKVNLKKTECFSKRI